MTGLLKNEKEDNNWKSIHLFRYVKELMKEVGEKKMENSRMKRKGNDIINWGNMNTKKC